ncbi:MAG: peptidyl-prolyl cis-trans isomerase [Thermodesulfobacteriota bacterium]
MVNRKEMNRSLRIFTALALIILLFGCHGSGGEPSGEEVIINVGGRTVTVASFEARVKRTLGDGGHNQDSNGQGLERAAIRRDVAAELIEEELILGEAARLGIVVEAGELRAESARIREEAVGEGFEKGLTKAYGSMKGWLDELNRRLLIEKTIALVLDEAVEVKKADAKKYYEKNIKDYDTPLKVHARMIVLSTEDEAEKVRAGLTKENFSDTAKKVSLSPEADKGGDLGFFAKGEMPEEFEKAVFSLKPGEISETVKTDYGYHIFLLEAKKSGKRLTFAEASDEIYESMRHQLREARFEQWINSLKKNTHIEVREEFL